MIAGLAITIVGLAFGAPQEHPASESDASPAVEQAAGDQHAAEGEHAEEWGTETMMHHIVDSGSLEFGPVVISLDRLKIPPVRIGKFEIDLCPAGF